MVFLFSHAIIVVICAQALTNGIMKSNPPKSHHFVPRIYLKQFAAAGTVYVLDMVKVKKGFKETPHKRHINDICYQDNLYAIEQNKSHDSLGLDQFESLIVETTVLHRLENRYPQLLELMTTKNEIDYADVLDIADFILQMKLRNPFHLKGTIEKNKTEWVSTIAPDIVYNDDRFSGVPAHIREEVVRQLRFLGEDPSYAKGLQLFSLIERAHPDLKKNERIRQAVIDSTWELLEIPDTGSRFTWITSDNPGVAMDRDGLYYNTRFKNGFTFYFPLSPRYCLKITDAQQDFTYSKQAVCKSVHHTVLKPVEVLQINDCLIQRINKLIIAAHPWYLEQIALRNKPTDGSRK